jgi:hypothetical protein
MDTTKLIDKLENFFDLSEKKQCKKHDKLMKIIHELEEKKSRLEQRLQNEREIDAGSSRYQGLQRKLVVVSNLISKAKQKDLAD